MKTYLCEEKRSTLSYNINKRYEHNNICFQDIKAINTSTSYYTEMYGNNGITYCEISIKKVCTWTIRDTAFDGL